MGKGLFFFDPPRTIVDVQRPWMLSIGEYCKVTQNVTILAHDYSRSVLRRKYGEIIGEAKVTFIGDNVFLGAGSTVCMGAKIGNNVIIGAGSVVIGEIPDDVVVAGTPARVICTLDEYYERRKARTVSEAILYAKRFYNKYNRYPNEREMGPFWQLFMPRDIGIIREKSIFTKLSGDNEDEILDAFLKTEPVFGSYEDFICSVKENKDAY